MSYSQDLAPAAISSFPDAESGSLEIFQLNKDGKMETN